MIIKHGLVMDPASGLSEHMDILVKDGKIVKIAPEITDNTEEILEARGLIVGPGLLDTHVHFRDPGFTYKEDIHNLLDREYKVSLFGIDLAINTIAFQEQDRVVSACATSALWSMYHAHIEVHTRITRTDPTVINTVQPTALRRLYLSIAVM